MNQINNFPYFNIFHIYNLFPFKTIKRVLIFCSYSFTPYTIYRYGYAKQRFKFKFGEN